MFKRLKSFFDRSSCVESKALELYLAGSTDLTELERRQMEWAHMSQAQKSQWVY